MDLPMAGSPMTFQSTLSVRRATNNASECSFNQDISIHALRKESDDTLSSIASRYGDFNPRSP